MKKIITILLLTGLCYAKYIDFGIRGNLYEIKEKSFMQLIQEKYKEVNLIQLKKDLNKSANESLIAKSSLVNCTENKSRVYEPYQIIKEDITLPYFNQVLFKKGYKYNVIKENNIMFRKYLIFIDADSKIQLALARKYSKVADIYAVKGNLLNLKKSGIPIQMARDKFEVKNFNIQCLPSIYAQDGYKFNIQEYKLKEDNNNDK